MQPPKPSSSITIRQSKVNQASSIALLLKELHPRQVATFLAGFVIGELKLGAINNQNSTVLKCLAESLELIRDQVITQMSYIEACIQALQKTKKHQSQKPQPRSPKKRNGMKNQQDYYMVAEQQSPIQNFNEVFSNLISDLALDSEYLKRKWKRELSIQDEERKTAQMISKIMEEEDERNRADEMKNLEVIGKMMAEDMERKKEEEDKKMECQICLVDIEYEDMAPLSNCGHLYHRQCIHEHIKAAILANTLDIPCPSEQCKAKLSANDVETYVQGEVLDKFYKFSLNKYVESADNNTSWCPTAGCSAAFEFDQLLDNYRCLVCRKHYCIKCRCDYHYGMTCAEYRITNTFSKDDKAFEDFVKGSKFKQCPKCKFWVERVSGCSSMACRCGVQFCYECGGTGCPHGRCSGSGKNGGGGGNEGGRGGGGGAALGGLAGIERMFGRHMR